MPGPRRFGEHVRFKREALGLSLRECARRLGVSHVFLGEVERGSKSMLVSDRRADLAVVLEVSEAEMQEWVDEEIHATTCPTCLRGGWHQ